MSKLLFLSSVILFACSCGSHQPAEKRNTSRDSIVAVLDTVSQQDQDGRLKIMDTIKKYGNNSDPVNNLWKTINTLDSIDVIKVTSILDKYGWLGPLEIGEQGNTTLFLVIQHAPLQIQKKYLPLMQSAVKNKNANLSDLALLEDRVNLAEGKKQMYGSQVRTDSLGNTWVAPIEDPDNVDNRRAKAGLQPMSDYVKQFNITWNLEDYKHKLPEIEKKEKSLGLSI